MAEIFWPYDPSIINYGFGYPPGYGGFHNGIDFPVKQGTPIKATVSGVVRNNDAGAKDGAGVDITAPDGWMTRHWHVSKFLVPNGTRVNAGDVVALSGGARGTWGAGNSTGAHLHWGLMINRQWVNPASYSPQFFDKPKPPQPVIGDDDEMKIVRDTEGTYWLATPNGMFGISDPSRLELLQRMLKSNPENPEKFTPGQIQFLSEYLVCDCKN